MANTNQSAFTEDIERVYLALSGEYNAKHSDLEYEGFDPRNLVSNMRKKESDITKMMKDVNSCSIFYATRGTKINKVIGQLPHEQTKNEFTAIIQKYGIQDKLKKNDTANKRKDQITISRMAAAFPMQFAMAVACRLNMYKATANQVQKAEIGIPWFLCLPAGAALCPNDQTFDEWLKWAVEFDKVINPNRANEMNVRRYGKVAYDATTTGLTKSRRATFCLTMYGKYPEPHQAVVYQPEGVTNEDWAAKNTVATTKLTSLVQLWKTL